MQQVENTTQRVDQQWQQDIGQFNQRVQTVQRATNEAKETLHRCVDLLDLCLQKVEETAQSWASIQQRFIVWQGEVGTMKLTQTELLTPMQRLNNML